MEEGNGLSQIIQISLKYTTGVEEMIRKYYQKELRYWA